MLVYYKTFLVLLEYWKVPPHCVNTIVAHIVAAFSKGHAFLSYITVTGFILQQCANLYLTSIFGKAICEKAIVIN